MYYANICIFTLSSKKQKNMIEDTLTSLFLFLPAIACSTPVVSMSISYLCLRVDVIEVDSSSR